MNNRVTEDDSMVDVIRREGISAVWLVPVIAFLFGGWLLFKSIADRGVFINIQFESAEGIVVGSTEVKYKGLTLGTVKDVEVSEDLRNVEVKVEMLKQAEPMLTDKTLFWYVTADVSFQGVTGLDTLLSGSYISVQPDLNSSGKATRSFVALEQSPELDKNAPGLHLTLTAPNLGSISKNSPVTYKQMEVGHVSGHEYDEESNQVLIHAYIEPQYAHLVKDISRFWNVSGFNVTGSLTAGIQINTESLAAVVAGGIAFDNVDYEQAKAIAENGQRYTLYDDYLSAEMGHEIRLILGWNSNLDVGSSLVFQGLVIGKIKSFEVIDPEEKKIIAVAEVTPRITRYLTTASQFYIESPEFDLGGVTNLNQMLTGSHIVVRPSMDGDKSSVFPVYNIKPAYNYSEPGLHLVLQATSLDYLSIRSGVYFEQQQVGIVEAIETKGPNDYLVHIFIRPEYQRYVSSDSHFWNASGMRVTGGFQHFEVQAQSLQTILKGGIAFDVGVEQDADQPENGDLFQLFVNKDVAKERVAFEIMSPTTKGLKTGMRIMYRGEEIGSVHEIDRYHEQVILSVGLLPEYEYVLKETTQFWLVQANLSLSGLTDTEALLGGAYFTLNAGDGEPTDRFIASIAPPKKLANAEGLQLSLAAQSGNVARPGSPISYRGVIVGAVDNIELNEASDNVLVHLTIDEQYRHLINAYTRFYSASGVTISGNFSELIVKTESMDTILTGGISFYNGAGDDSREEVKEGDQFTLFDNVKLAEAAGKPITIYFNEIDGLKDGLQIKYKGQSIGVIERVSFEHDKYGAKAIAFLNEAGKKFAVDGTKFWMVSPKLGLVGSQHLDAIIEKYIGALPGRGKEKVSFNAEDQTPTITELPYGLNIQLVAKQLGSVRVGNPVLYRQVQVGKVIGIDLASTADSVNIYVNIATKYANLVTSKSTFWNASGVNIDAGILSGIEIDSESIETLLAGGIAFATPESPERLNSVDNGHRFELSQDFQEEWHDWQPVIPIDNK